MVGADGIAIDGSAPSATSANYAAFFGALFFLRVLREMPFMVACILVAAGERFKAAAIFANGSLPASFFNRLSSCGVHERFVVVFFSIFLAILIIHIPSLKDNRAYYARQTSKLFLTRTYNWTFPKLSISIAYYYFVETVVFLITIHMQCSTPKKAALAARI